MSHNLMTETLLPDEPCNLGRSKMLLPYPSTRTERDIEMIDSKYKGPALIVFGILIILLAYGAMTMKDKPPVTNNISETYPALSGGVGKPLENPTPEQKSGDAVKDTGEPTPDSAQPSDAR